MAPIRSGGVITIRGGGGGGTANPSPVAVDKAMAHAKKESMGAMTISSDKQIMSMMNLNKQMYIMNHKVN